MGVGGSGAVLRQVDRLFGRGTVAGLGEGQLLERYLAGRDEVAFEALVSRHGPMVLGVCRRLLGDPHDVEDAFQATFLVLVKKAGAIRDRDLLGPWLYGVAHRVAVRARGRAAVRRSREVTGSNPETAARPVEAGADELRPVLDEEIGRLPEKYRVPILLCYFEGLSHDQAAANLRWPVGTVRSRLARGRDLLRGRLARRGLAPVAGLIASGLTPRATSAAVSPALIEATVRAATRLAAGRMLTAGAVSASVASLTKGVVTTMFLGNLKVAAVGLVAAGIVASGAGVWAGRGLKASDGPNGAPAPIEGDLARLQGKWEAIRTTPALNDQWQFRKPGSWKYTWEIEGSRITRVDFERNENGSAVETSARDRFRLDEARTPKGIDFVTTEGSRVITAGIYKLEGDRLTVCLAEYGTTTPPRDFKADENHEAPILMVFRRQGRGSTGGQSGDDAPNAPAPERGQGTPGSPDEREADVARLRGRWTRVSTTTGGRRQDFPGLSGPKLHISDGTFLFGGPGRVSPERFTLDESKSPKEIDLTPTGEAAGPLRGKTYPGIYKLEGDTLTLCLAPTSGASRPSGFSTQYGDGRVLDVYRRESSGPNVGDEPGSRTPVGALVAGRDRSASDEAARPEAVPNPPPAPPTPSDPTSAATASAPIVDLENRLRRAQDKAAWAERMFQKGYVSQAQLAEARDEVEFLKARIADWARGLESLRDDLQEEQERLRGRIATMKKELQGLEAELEPAIAVIAAQERLNNRRPGMVSEEEMNRAQAEAKGKAARRDVKQAEIKEVEIHLDQVARRLSRLDRAKDRAKEAAPNPPAPPAAPAPATPAAPPASPAPAATPAAARLPAPPAPPARPARPEPAPAPPPDQPRPAEPRSPDVGMASIRELGARLRSAQALLDTRTKLFKKGELNLDVVQQAQGEVETLKARIDSLQDALQDERELLEAQFEAKRAELRRAESQHAFAVKELERYKGLASRSAVSQQMVNEFEAKAEEREAERDAERAELKEVEIRLKQVGRRLARIDQPNDQAKGPAPEPPAPSPAPSPDRPVSPDTAPPPPPPPSRPRAVEPGRSGGGSTSIRGLGARLRSAQTVLDMRTRLYKSGHLSLEDWLWAQGEVEIAKADLDSQRDALQDERELLAAQREAKQAEVRRAEKNSEYLGKQLERFKDLAAKNAAPRQVVDEFEDKAEASEAERDAKRAELGLIDIRLKQAQRRLDLIEQVRSQANEPVPAPTIPTGAPRPPPR